MTDVHVIGGGPAGSSAAIRLARTGRSVTLFEKAHFPRAKLCGGFISPEALDDLAELDVLKLLREAGAVPIRRTVIAGRGGTPIESPLLTEGLSVSRDILDDLLIKEAIRHQVSVRFGEDGFAAPPAELRVVATGRKTNETSFTPRYASAPTDFWGLQALFTETHGITDQVELDLVNNGYVGLTNQNGGMVNVCALTTAETIRHYGPSPDAVLRHWMDENPILCGHLTRAQRVGEWMAVGPVRLGIRKLSRANTFYVGDAACVVDPFAGEGMAMGLYTSHILTRALAQSTRPAADVYAELWRQAFIPSLRWNAVMRAFYSVPVLRDIVLQGLRVFPTGLTWMAELTRRRELELL